MILGGRNPTWWCGRRGTKMYTHLGYVWCPSRTDVWGCFRCACWRHTYARLGRRVAVRCWWLPKGVRVFGPLGIRRAALHFSVCIGLRSQGRTWDASEEDPHENLCLSGYGGQDTASVRSRIRADGCTAIVTLVTFIFDRGGHAAANKGRSAAQAVAGFAAFHFWCPSIAGTVCLTILN